MTGKMHMVPCLARAVERTANFSLIFSYYVRYLNLVKKSEDNFIANGIFTSLVVATFKF